MIQIALEDLVEVLKLGSKPATEKKAAAVPAPTAAAVPAPPVPRKTLTLPKKTATTTAAPPKKTIEYSQEAKQKLARKRKSRSRAVT